MAVPRIGGRRRIALLTALSAWAGLGLQLAITTAQSGPGPGLWLYFGFFTILTNLLVAIVASRLAMGRDTGLSGSRTRMAATAAIAMVGIAYWLLLAGTWKPEGWQLVADVILHTLTPLVAVMNWWAWRDGSLQWGDAWRAAIWPAAYAVYALARGSIDGWYAYWFFDPNRQGWGEIVFSVIALSALVVGIALLLIAADRRKKAVPTKENSP